MEDLYALAWANLLVKYVILIAVVVGSLSSYTCNWLALALSNRLFYSKFPTRIPKSLTTSTTRTSNAKFNSQVLKALSHAPLQRVSLLFMVMGWLLFYFYFVPTTLGSYHPDNFLFQSATSFLTLLPGRGYIATFYLPEDDSCLHCLGVHYFLSLSCTIQKHWFSIVQCAYVFESLFL